MGTPEEKARKREYNQVYYKANRDKVLAMNRTYREAHLEEARARDRAYSTLHNAERQSYAKTYRETHKDDLQTKDRIRGKTDKRLAANRARGEKNRVDRMRYLKQYRAAKQPPKGARSSPSGEGTIYVVQLEPDLLPERIKVGFTRSITKRLGNYRAANPFALLVYHRQGSTMDEAKIHRLLEHHALVPRRRGKPCEVYNLNFTRAAAIIDAYFERV